MVVEFPKSRVMFLAKAGYHIVQSDANRKYQQEFEIWEETCAAMTAEEEKARYHLNPRGVGLLGYWLVELCGLAEIPFRCVWHCGVCGCVLLTMGPCAICAEIAASGGNQHPSKDVSKREQSDSNNSEKNVAWTRDATGNRVRVEAPTQEVQDQYLRHDNGRFGSEPKSPCAAVVAAVIGRNCQQLRGLSLFCQILAHNMCCECAHPYYFFAKGDHIRGLVVFRENDGGKLFSFWQTRALRGHQSLQGQAVRTVKQHVAPVVAVLGRTMEAAVKARAATAVTAKSYF
jgi:hypothetical protein